MKKMGLEPCLGCRSVKMLEEQVGDTYRISCPKCKAATLWFDTRREAKVAWNERELAPAKKPPLDEDVGAPNDPPRFPRSDIE
jgi:hypothetical protein